MKIYLLNNGVNVRLMAITGPRLSSEELFGASALVRDFFGVGTKKEISEVTIRDPAAETIIRAISAFHDAPVPLVTALSELLNSCRDLENRRSSHGIVPTLQSPDFLSSLVRQV